MKASFNVSNLKCIWNIKFSPYLNSFKHYFYILKVNRWKDERKKERRKVGKKKSRSPLIFFLSFLKDVFCFSIFHLHNFFFLSFQWVFWIHSLSLSLSFFWHQTYAQTQRKKWEKSRSEEVLIPSCGLRRDRWTN